MNVFCCPIYRLPLRLKLNCFVQCKSSFKFSTIEFVSPKNPIRDGIKLKAPPDPVSEGVDSKISQEWMEYQGINGWEGLLDPLDDDLRREILRYGEFVEAAYGSFDFNPSSPTYATCKYPRSLLLSCSGFRRKGYRVTKNLHATCGVELPDWPVKVPSWMLSPSSWIGYVAVCHDKSEISRLGRRDVVIAFRGTGTCLEWIENLRTTLTCLHGRSDPDMPMVQRGFLSLYTSRAPAQQSLRDMIREEVGRIIETYGKKPLSLTITGHSLGAALATLAAYDIQNTFEDAPMVTVVSFGGPRVGNESFRRQLENRGINILRIVNSDDPITKVPGFVTEKSGTGAVDHESAISATRLVLRVPSWLHQQMSETQWLYVDIGRELRFSSKDYPDLNNISVAACHDLKTYLRLVESKCPFKATARKVLSMHPRDSFVREQKLNIDMA